MASKDRRFHRLSQQFETFHQSWAVMHLSGGNGLWVRARSNILLFLAVAQTLGAEASLIAFGNSYSDAGQGANAAVHAALGITQVTLRLARLINGILL